MSVSILKHVETFLTDDGIFNDSCTHTHTHDLCPCEALRFEVIKFYLKHIYVYIGFKTFFYVVRHLDSIASYLPTGLLLGFFRSWPSLYISSSFYSGFLVLSFVSAPTSMLFWVEKQKPVR